MEKGEATIKAQVRDDEYVRIARDESSVSETFGWTSQERVLLFE